MKKVVFCIFLFCKISFSYAQKDSLKLGDTYADDQIYASISYAQLSNQPSIISKSEYSLVFTRCFYGVFFGFKYRLSAIIFDHNYCNIIFVRNTCQCKIAIKSSHN